MNDLMTDSFVGAAAAPQPQQGGGSAPSGDAGAEKLQAFLAETEVAKNEMAALRDELSQLQSAHEASKSLLRPGAPRAATQAALVRLLGSARRLRTRLASMDRRAPAPAAQATAGLRGRLQDLTAGVQTLRRQVSAERRGDAARRYLAVAGEAPTEDQLDRLVSSGGAGAAATDADEAVRAAMLSSSEAAEVEGGLLELQQLFLDMAALVESQGPRLEDIEQQVSAAAQHVGAAEGELRDARQLQVAARRRKMWLAGGIAAFLLVVLAVAAVMVAMALARQKGGSVQLAGAGLSDLVDLPL
jgi:syntaxin 1B/2/3